MPELPEVETVRRHLEPAIVGRRIADVDVRRPRMVRRNEHPTDVPDRLNGRLVKRLGRHGKFLIAELEEDIRLVLHLGMSGRIRLVPDGGQELAHTNVVILLETEDQDAPAVHFVDPRTFGFLAAWTDEEFRASTLSQMGPDALNAPPSPQLLAKRLSRRALPIKAALLDQRIIAGLGNIYADEILNASRVHPLRKAGSLDDHEIGAITDAIGPVLAAGIAAGGTSLDDMAFLLPDDRAGQYMARLAVYGRTGEACFECGAEIERVVVAGRSSHFCPICQPYTSSVKQ